MYSTAFFFLALPVIAIALSFPRYRLRPMPTIVAALTANVVGLFLYANYNHWTMRAILRGYASGALTYAGAGPPRNAVSTFLVLLIPGLVVAMVALLLRWAFVRIRRIGI